MRGRMIVIGGLLLAGLLGGCVAQGAREALDAATVAEQRIGSSGSRALSSVAALTSRLGDSVGSTSSSLTVTIARLDALLQTTHRILEDARPGVREIAGIASEVHATASVFRVAAEDGWLSRKMFYAVVIGFVVLLVHSVVSMWRMKKRIVAMHEDVKGVNGG